MGRHLGAASGISCTQKLANVLLLQGHLVLQGRTPRPAELLHNARTPFIGIIAPALRSASRRSISASIPSASGIVVYQSWCKPPSPAAPHSCYSISSKAVYRTTGRCLAPVLWHRGLFDPPRPFANMRPRPCCFLLVLLPLAMLSTLCIHLNRINRDAAWLRLESETIEAVTSVCESCAPC